MVDPNEARKVLADHFGQISLDEFNRRKDQYVGEDPQSQIIPVGDASETRELILFQREAMPLKLDAYLATALTGLTEPRRQELFAVSDVVDSVCTGLDISLYQPRNHTDPVHHPEVSSQNVFRQDRERVLKSDLVVHIADHPSTGAGEELDFALSALVPIILIAHGETRVSRMVAGIPGFKLEITYKNLEYLEIELRERLTEIRPVLEARKLVFSDFDKNMVGSKARILREELHLTREDIARHSNGLFTIDKLAQIEDNTDKIGNPTLLELRTLAALLKTTVADLVEPDLNERVIAVLQEWMVGNVAARYEISPNDQKRVVRQLLYRVLSSLDGK